MKSLRICDNTLKLNKNQLSFRKKTDIAAILDGMKIPVIELGDFDSTTESRLFIKTAASNVKNSVLSVCVGVDPEKPAVCMESLKDAARPRLKVMAALSTARMEYVYGKKQNEMLDAVKNTVSACKKLCEDVEFAAEDATRADFDFLKTVLSEAIDAGATTVTLCDTAGDMLPYELSEFLEKLQTELPGLQNVVIGVECSNALGLADACTASAIKSGAYEIKASACGDDTASLSGIIRILNAKVGVFPVSLELDTENFAHPIKVITNLCSMFADEKTPFEYGVREKTDDVFFSEQDSEEAVYGEIQRLGYILSHEDREKVYSAFKRIVSKKSKIDLNELEVIVASEALQVPQTYRLDSSIVTTGNKCDALAHIKLMKNGALIDGVSLGNGAVDASFLAIEKITGCHYELDDFQIQAITEGKEALGQTLVKLRSNGKIYSGKGVSTDIVMSAIEAYLNALNKIAYEEEQV